MPASLHGFAASLALIIAIGSQNVFVLRQGLRRQHVLAVVTVCILSDVVLIAAGAGGVGLLVRDAPGLVTAARWGGAAFLLVYAASAARRALRPDGDGLEPSAPESARGGGVWPVVLTALALTWLNPHVYLDTVLLLGSIAATHGQQSPSFALGAIAASASWFLALGFGARGLGRFLRSPRAWRVLDGGIAVTMIVIAILLVSG
ncbi:LysE/ArgO family amino acid transporter [Brachybacterium sacelli]|uniref:L-lysine exporter family protein LysE/ArgO n=1 Tax=Brachybacterium sacelli TaxID=173364 RepID=A0ABS4X6X2_9MICO|nr:L-lysine exporter family protein LysE/ArgO [Brachybacterium sacelli]